MYIGTDRFPEAPAVSLTGPKTGRLKRVEPKRPLVGDSRGFLTRK